MSAFELGDPTLSVLEIWGAEYQESNALLVHADDRSMLERIAAREKCPVSFVGCITNDGKVRWCASELVAAFFALILVFIVSRSQLSVIISAWLLLRFMTTVRLPCWL